MANLPLIAKDYAPYHTLPEFADGFEAYGKTWTNPYEGVAAQAWDRGLECGARTQRSFTQAVVAENEQLTLCLLVKPGTDFDDRFEAWDADGQEFIMVKGWLFSIEEGEG